MHFKWLAKFWKLKFKLLSIQLLICFLCLHSLYSLFWIPSLHRVCFPTALVLRIISKCGAENNVYEACVLIFSEFLSSDIFYSFIQMFTLCITIYAFKNYNLNFHCWNSNYFQFNWQCIWYVCSFYFLLWIQNLLRLCFPTAVILSRI